MNLRNASILVIDDDTDVLTAVRLLLKTEAKNIVTELNPENINHLLSGNHFDIVLLDMNFKSSINTGNEGLFWLQKIKEINNKIAVIMITAYGDIDLAVKSLKEGAVDFIVKPWHNERLLETIRNILKNKESQKINQKKISENFSSEMLGESEVFKDIFFKIEKVAPTDANIFILGENGTGKDLIAKAIHENSFRAQKPFVKVDVGSLTETLFESELFGHEKGAFTGAGEEREGRFTAANGGTLFLDEIGNISMHQQAKLLSVLQNRQVSRVGSNKTTDIDIRLISATNLPFAELGNEKRFRKDLIYRINTVEITVPPLRERGTDVILLAKHFAAKYAERYSKSKPLIEDSAIQKLQQYYFPGNVRELQYCMERAVIMLEGNTIAAKDVIFSPIEAAKTLDQELKTLNLGAVEKNTILKVIDKHNGNISKAARELGITRTALYRRLSKYEL